MMKKCTVSGSSKNRNCKEIHIDNLTIHMCYNVNIMQLVQQLNQYFYMYTTWYMASFKFTKNQLFPRAAQRHLLISLFPKEKTKHHEFLTLKHLGHI